MSIDGVVNDSLSRMYRAEETYARVNSRDTDGRVQKAHFKRGGSRGARDSLEIGASNEVTFAQNLIRGLEGADRAGGADRAQKDGETKVTGCPAETPAPSDVSARQTSELSKEEGTKEVRTPFGIYKLNSQNQRQVISLTGVSESRAYFMTHQPGEWMYSTAAREEFVRVYGEEALITLDWDGTVPENLDPIWVTRRPVGPDGRPLPGSKFVSSDVT